MKGSDQLLYTNNTSELSGSKLLLNPLDREA